MAESSIKLNKKRKAAANKSSEEPSFNTVRRAGKAHVFK
jgi:hypothetical protein